MEQNQNALAVESDGDSAHGSLAVIASAPAAPVAEYDSATGTFVMRAAAPAPVPFARNRADGWTPDRQARFLEELADCGVVQEAAARVGMSRQSAWQLRRRAEGTAFGDAFEVALRAGLQALHSVAFERAVEGVAVPVFYRGEKVGERRAYDNRLLLLSLIGGAGRPPESHRATIVRRDWDAWLDAIERGQAAPVPRLADAGDRDNPVWADEDGIWWTDYPPPEGTTVTEEGDYGDDDYRRTLGSDERAALEAVLAAHRDRAAVERDAFFGLEK